MRFREYGWAVEQTFPDGDLGRQALVDYLKQLFKPWPTLDKIDYATLKTTYSHDSPGHPDREAGPGWGPTYIITLKGYGVVGYTDTELEKADAD
jgi:hypothetical protein